MFKKRLGQKGFTLIELLVVIAIIGILSSVVLVSLQSSRAKARDAKRIADIGALQQALALYFDSNQHYPDASGQNGFQVLKDAGFLTALPVGPNPLETYNYVGSGDTGGSLSYHLGATLEQVNEGSGVLATDRDCRSGNTGTTALCTGFAPVTDGFDGGDQATHVYDVTP